MSGHKIEDLPAGPHIPVMLEAMERGKRLLRSTNFKAEAVLIVGLCDMIREMREEAVALRSDSS